MHLLPVAAVALLLAMLGAEPARAGHELGNSCYVCHNIKAGTTWQGTQSIWTGKDIGMSAPTGGKPIACDYCHVDHRLMFDNTTGGGSEKSAHPVPIIAGSGKTSYFGYGATVNCLDCHSGNTVTGFTPNLIPDVAPQDYVTKGTNTGYPNHDVAIPNNQISIGNDPPHLTLSTSSYNSYDNTPATAGGDSDSKYALCFSCHSTGSTKIIRATGKTIQTDYQLGGHYFQGGAWANKTMPCSDCHGSHRSGDSSRLMVPKLTSGTWPGVVYSSASSPTGSDIRTMCNACHDDTGATTNGTPTIRNREPSAKPSKVAEHVGGSVSCAVCHPVHNPKVGTDCLGCHKTGTGKAGSYEYVGMLFKDATLPGGARPDNTVDGSSRPWSWSQHGNSLTSSHYVSPYNGKTTNFCYKCHGDRHNGTAGLIQADAGDTSTEAFTPVDNLAGTTVANANNFCLSCHDGDGNADDVTLGGVSPPVVSRTNWTGSGHGKESGSYTVSNNSAANVKCVSCHEVHGSNHANLLPADNTDIPPFSPNFRLPAGTPGKTVGATLASALDFRDYTNPAVAGAGFDNNWAWSRGFGTVGDPSNQYGPNEGNKYGLCDACHRNDPSVNQTLNKAHTHMGIKDQGDPKSQMSFVRDCAECHDVHGGRKGTPNIYMISDNVAFRPGTAQAAVRDVTFTSLTGLNSFDDNTDAGGSNTGDLCTVCHEYSGAPDSSPINVSHNYYNNGAAADHKENQNCLGCHPHGASDNALKFGFPSGGACNSCHGWSDADGMPSYNDGGTYNPDANPSLSTRGAGDNTAHKVHVNYLVTRLGLNAATRVNACYVCHKGGGGNESHPENPTTTNYSQPSPTPDAQYVDIALDNAIVGFGAGKPQPSYSGTKGLAANATNGWKTCNNTTCHYAESPSWAGKKQISGDTVTMTWDNQASGSVAKGSVNNKMLRISLTADSIQDGAAAMTVVRVTRTGTGVDADVPANGVKVYLDDGDGVFEPGVQDGSPVGTGSFAGWRRAVRPTCCWRKPPRQLRAMCHPRLPARRATRPECVRGNSIAGMLLPRCGCWT